MSSSPKLNDIGNNDGDNVNCEEDDEVKIFRSEEVDDGPSNDPLDELTADKTDVAFEADIETEPLGQRSAFSATQSQMPTIQNIPNLAYPSPNYEIFKSLIMASLSPQIPYNPLGAMGIAPMSPIAQAAANYIIKNSPSYQQQYAAAAAAAAAQFRAGVPNFNLVSPFSAGALLQPALATQNLVFNSMNDAHTRQTTLPSTSTSSLFGSTGISTLNSPLSSMANGLNGMSLLDKSQNAHRNIYKSVHSTPKRIPASFNGGDMNKTPKREKSREEKKDHVKKPCNAFMWYMRENRARLLKEEGGQQIQSAIINKKLGIEWQNMSKKEQQKYFDMAAKEREMHQRLHPDWTARDNYAIKKKNKKKLREKSNENNDQKKCRARYGVDNQHMWCKHCKRKKRCLNVREVESPSHQVSSTTNPQMPTGTNGLNMSSKINIHQGLQGLQESSLMLLQNQTSQHMSSSSSNASSSCHVDSPSSSGVVSVGKRTESNASSNFDSNTPPPNGSQLTNNTQLNNALANNLNNFATPKAEQSFGPNGTPIVGLKNELSDDMEIPKPMPSHMHQLITQQNFFNPHHQFAAAMAAAASNMQSPPYFVAAAAGLAAASAGFGSPHNFFRQ